jgi:hypothetical protein
MPVRAAVLAGAAGEVKAITPEFELVDAEFAGIGLPFHGFGHPVRTGA